MPFYQYRCLNCKKRFEVFLSYSEYGQKPVHCPQCASDQVQRRIGRVRIARSEDSRMENLPDPDSLEGLEDDPRALGQMMRKMSREAGEDMGEDFDEVVNRLEAGQSPEDIEKAMPELADESGGMGGLDDDF
jgi:putative FmdB family regulatory protein